MCDPAGVKKFMLIGIHNSRKGATASVAPLPRRCRGLNYVTPLGVKKISGTEAASTGTANCRPQADLRDHEWVDRPQLGQDMLAHGDAVGIGPDEDLFPVTK